MKLYCFKLLLSVKNVIFTFLIVKIKPLNQLMPQMKARKTGEEDMGDTSNKVKNNSFLINV